MIEYEELVRQMDGALPTEPLDLKTIDAELFQAIGDRLRAEGKLSPLRDILLLCDRDGVSIGTMVRQEDGAWTGSMRMDDTWVSIRRDADDAPVIVVASEGEMEEYRDGQSIR